MTRRSKGSPRVCPDCGITGEPGDTTRFLSNGSTRCRACSRSLARKRYPERREEIAAKRRQRRELMREAADDGSSLEPLLDAHRTHLRIRAWIRYGSGSMEEVVGHPWKSVSAMLASEGLDRELLGLTWELDLSRGVRLEDWIINRL